ncbi:toll/interleukin-1 receptor domain-containing protein [Candidatus Woesebacteria bacterium]|nr:toll/interleukin-1 receptor domain-containing protein [Candidatus Woesebacteria bacterium]
MIEEETLKFKSFEEACDYFKETKPKPKIFINSGSAAEDVQLAKRVYRALKTNGLDVYYGKEDILPGQDWQLELEKQADYCTHMIDIVSAARGKSDRLGLTATVKTRSAELDRQTHLFQLAASDPERTDFLARVGRNPDKVNIWEKPGDKIALIKYMIEVGPGGPKYIEDESADTLIVIDGIRELPSNCDMCGGPVADRYKPKCEYCGRGITHMEKPVIKPLESDTVAVDEPPIPPQESLGLKLKNLFNR